MQPSPRSAELDTGRRRLEYLVVDGRKLRNLRLLLGRTQVQAARLAVNADGKPLDRNQWTLIENGSRPRVKPHTAFRLARGIAPADASDADIEALIKQFAQFAEESPAGL